MKDKKHLYWVVGLVLITLVLCGTLIWLNYNSWTIRLEMDDNTLKAIESIEYPLVNNVDCVNEGYWYNNGEGITLENVDWEEYDKTMKCLKQDAKEMGGEDD